MKLGLKKDVVFTPSQAIVDVLPTVLHAYKFFTAVENVIITSGNDSKHMRGSKHYVNDAIDLRVWGLSALERTRVVTFLQVTCGRDYDVLDEIRKNHIHLEYDRK